MTLSLVYFYKLADVMEASPELSRTFWGVLKQASWAAAGAAMGGIIAGPVGAFVGTMAGGMVGLSRSDDYKSLILALRELSDEEKYRMQDRIQELVGSGTIEALMEFIRAEANRQLLLTTVQQSLKATGA